MNRRANLSSAHGVNTVVCEGDSFSFAEGTLYARHMHEMLTEVEQSPFDLSVFVSCFNEQNYIADTLDTVVAALSETDLTYEIIIVDDCSNDRSAEVVRSYIESCPDLNIALKVNSYNRGLGQNFSDAIFLGSGKYFRHVCGDNVEPLETLRAVFGAVGRADLILPYHVDIEGKSHFRQVVSRIYTKIINLLSGQKIKYYNGLPLFNRADLERALPLTTGFAFQADVVTRILARGATYIEVPVKMVETKASAALNVRNLLSVLHIMFQIVVRRVAGWYHARRRRRG